MTLGIIVLFVGKRVNDVVGFLREFSIPEPVTGGLIFSVIFGLVFAATGTAVEFDLGARDCPAGLFLRHHRDQREPQGPVRLAASRW